MRHFVTGLLVAAFIIASVWAALKFKLAADASGKTALWHFIEAFVSPQCAAVHRTALAASTTPRKPCGAPWTFFST